MSVSVPELKAADRLAILNSSQISMFLRSPEIDEQWYSSAARLAEICQIEDAATRGVNIGDRRALFYLVRALLPTSILEIGSHVGASTLYIAAAMPYGSTLATIDIREVNNAPDAYWRTAGLRRSPMQMLIEFDADLHVDFVVSDSVAYLRNTKRLFDFIFLDGDHAMETVLSEVAMSLNVLNKEGIIVLHDYFPEGKPIWPGRAAISGPFNAVEKLRAAGAPLKVVSLGELPWETKLGSRLTSLGLLVGKR